MTEAARLASRLRRVEGYSQWLADDVDGLIANLNHPEPLPCSTAILAETREKIALALGRLDRAIEQDRKNNMGAA